LPTIRQQQQGVMLAGMSSAPYSVSIVLDRSYGSRLQELFKVGPAWAVDSPANRHCAEQLWAEFPARDHLDGITIFRTAEDRSPEQVLIDEIGTIDEHHGIYSADPPYTVIRVVGSALTPEVRQVLERFGFDCFTINSGGFDAVRPLPPPLVR
jgi:hypothetical protein